jgi:hypothetical protein
MNGRPAARVTALLLIFAIAFARAAAGPDTLGVSSAAGTAADTTDQSPDAVRLAVVGGTVVLGMAAVHVYQQSGWWKDNQTSFHFREDLDYGKGVDKLGHFYGATVLTFLFSRSLEWAHLSREHALLLGAGTSLLFQTYVEVRDGFSAWGFDRVDFLANVGGAFYPVIQHHVPLLRSFNMKFSYHPSELLDNPGGIGFRGQKHIMFDDYEGQTFWLSMKVDNLLPSGAKPFWPDWLDIVVGYGARQVASPEAHGIYLIGIDFDMTRIIPQDTAFLRTLSEALNFIRLPAPAVQVSPNAVWYGLYF